MKFARTPWAVDLRRVEIAQPPLHAVLPAGVAIDKASRAAQSESPASTDRDCAGVPRDRYWSWRGDRRCNIEPTEDGGHGERARKASEADRDEGDQEPAAVSPSVCG